VSAMTHDGRAIRMMTMIDEYTRECLAICKRYLSFHNAVLLPVCKFYCRLSEGIPAFVGGKARESPGLLGVGNGPLEI
jgi:hypothetical protein